MDALSIRASDYADCSRQRNYTHNFSMTPGSPSLPRGRQPHLYRAPEVPQLFREPGILTSYRSSRCTARACVLSTLTLNNETLNIWTHLLAACYYAYHTAQVLAWLIAEDDLHLLALFFATLSVFTYTATSCAAHIFNAMSVRARHVCFFLDYWALSFYGFASAVAYHAYSFPGWTHEWGASGAYLPLSAVLGCAMFALACQTRFMELGPWRKHFKTVRLASFLVPYLFDLLPMIYWTLTDSLHPPARYYHRRQYLFALLSLFFYASHLPERCWPGRFDVWGHSHQIFHAFTAIGSRDQLLTMWIDSQQRTGTAVEWAEAYVVLVLGFVVVTIAVVAVNVGRLGRVDENGGLCGGVGERVKCSTSGHAANGSKISNNNVYNHYDKHC